MDILDIDKINDYSKKELSLDEVYVFKVNLCNNDIDRDYERFSVEALNELAILFKGKTGIFDHSMKSENQKARLFDAFVEKDENKKTLDGKDFYNLVGKAYMLRNEKNKSLIEEIEAGIKKEVSISCKTEERICGICKNDKRKHACGHVKGKYYDNRLCFDILNGASDAYEFSFVCVPAQKEAKIIINYSFDSSTTQN